MTFTLKSNGQNLQSFMRTLGYKPIGVSPEGQLNCVKPLMGGDYPRYHAYINDGPDGFVFNLHLDQKKPSYEGNHAHSGEYDGELVHTERKRIESFSTGSASSGKPWWQK